MTTRGKALHREGLYACDEQPTRPKQRRDGSAELDRLRIQLVKRWHHEQHGPGPCGTSCGLERALRGDKRGAENFEQR